jgi:hypothetical protein
MSLNLVDQQSRIEVGDLKSLTYESTKLRMRVGMTKMPRDNIELSGEHIG